MSVEGLLRLVAAECLVAALIAVAAFVSLARQAWREAAQTRARHEAWLERVSDSGWWLT